MIFDKLVISSDICFLSNPNLPSFHLACAHVPACVPACLPAYLQKEREGSYLQKKNRIAV